MLKRILLVEDDSFRVKYFIERFGQYLLKISETSAGAIEYLKKEKFDYIFLDNDLGPGNGEGVDVAKFLNTNPDDSNHPIVIVHSWNRPASERIKALLPNSVFAPFNTEAFYNLNLDI